MEKFQKIIFCLKKNSFSYLYKGSNFVIFIVTLAFYIMLDYSILQRCLFIREMFKYFRFGFIFCVLLSVL